MANVLFYADTYENASDQDVSIVNATLSADDNNSDAPNVADFSKRTSWSQAATPTVGGKLNFTFANSKTCDFIALIGIVNFSTWTTIDLEYESGGWSAVSNISSALGSLADGDHVITFDSQVATQWRLHFQTAGSQATVKALWMGAKEQFNFISTTTKEPRSASYKKPFSDVMVHTSINGNRKGFQITKIQDFRRTWEYDFDISVAEQLDSLFANTRGRLYPLMFQDIDGNTQFARLGNVGLEYTRENALYKYKSITLDEEL